MLYPIKLYFRQGVTLLCIFGSLFVNLAIWVWLLWQLAPTGQPVFLHYTVLFGVDKVGDWSQIFSLPLTGLAFIVVNTMLGWLCFQRDKFIGHFLHIVMLVVQLFLLTAAVLLVALNV